MAQRLLYVYTVPAPLMTLFMARALAWCLPSRKFSFCVTAVGAAKAGLDPSMYKHCSEHVTDICSPGLCKIKHSDAASDCMCKQVKKKLALLEPAFLPIWLLGPAADPLSCMRQVALQ